MSTRTARRQLIALLTIECAALATVALLHGQTDLGVPWRALGPWVETTPPETALTALGLQALTAATAWLIVTTTGYLLARTARLPALARLIGFATLPKVRGLIDRVCVLTAATALSFAPMAPVAMANEPAGIVPPGTESAGYVPVPAGFPTEAASGVGPADSTPATQYVVRPGDSFWRIAEATVAPDEEVATHWLRLVAANLERIRSGDPDLIFPGEIVVLPAKDAP